MTDSVVIMDLSFTSFLQELLFVAKILDYSAAFFSIVILAPLPRCVNELLESSDEGFGGTDTAADDIGTMAIELGDLGAKCCPVCFIFSHSTLNRFHNARRNTSRNCVQRTKESCDGKSLS